MRQRALLPAVAVFSLITGAVEAGQPVKSTVTAVEESPFDKGRLELSSASGAYFSVGHDTTLNYSSTAYRLGVMLSTPEGDGCLRGNCEFLVQLFGGSVFEGPGDYLAGAAVLLRYNFVQPEARWVPYVQLGGGMVYNDIYKNRSQRLIGQAWEFDLEASVGVRYFLSERRRWSVNLEGGYRHVSNADMADRNTGLNSLGAGIGLGLHF